MFKKTKLYLLTGFLGAGKTTFLTRVLHDLEGKKVAVIMNEFGKVGIDGAIIKKTAWPWWKSIKAPFFAHAFNFLLFQRSLKWLKGRWNMCSSKAPGLQTHRISIRSWRPSRSLKGMSTTTGVRSVWSTV